MSPTPQHAATGAFVVSMRGEIGGYTSPAHPSWHPAAKSTRRFLLFSSRRQEIFRRTLAEEWRVPPYNVRFTVDARTDNGILLEYSVFAATKRAANWIVESAKRLRMMLQVKLRASGFPLGSTTEAGNFEFLTTHIHERTKWEAQHGVHSTGSAPHCNCDPFTETSTVTFCQQNPSGGHLQVTHEVRRDPTAPPGVGVRFVDLRSDQLRSHRCKVQWPSFNCKCCDCKHSVMGQHFAQNTPTTAAPHAAGYAGYPPQNNEGGGKETPGQVFHNPWLDVDATANAHQWHKASDEGKPTNFRPLPANFRRRRTPTNRRRRNK